MKQKARYWVVKAIVLLLQKIVEPILSSIIKVEIDGNPVDRSVLEKEIPSSKN